jgi:hypothetical protein
MPYVVGVITAVLLLPLLSTTTPTAHAQPPPQQQKTYPQCPAGTTSFNHGKCQSEPTSLRCEPTDPFGNRLQLIDGKCYLVESVTPGCPDGEYYDIFTDRCEIAFTNDPSGSMPSCDYPGLAGFELIRFDGVWRCVKFTYYSEAIAECSTGVLNTETGKCEVKPGNNRV